MKDSRWERAVVENAPDPGSGGEDENVAGVGYPGDVKSATDDAGANMDEVAGAEVTEERGEGSREALDEEVEAGG
jgi:hypothetical protein